MSTRGAIAVRKDGRKDGRWVGVYNHWDSYPTELGKELWDYLHQDGIDLKQFAQDLLKYDDWRNFRDGGICPYCGKVGQGQPHSIRGDIAYPDIPSRFRDADEVRAYYRQLPAWQGRDADIERQVSLAVSVADNIKQTGYPDPEALHHQHGDLTNKITSDNGDPLFIEWVYIIDPIKRVLEILAHRRGKGTHTETSECGGYHEWQSPNYEHYLLATYSLDGNEPDWKELEARADQLGDVAYSLFGGD